MESEATEGVSFDDVYEMGAQLGMGFTSKVHACTHRASGRTFACKIMDKKKLQAKSRRGEFGNAIPLKTPVCCIDVDSIDFLPLVLIISPKVRQGTWKNHLWFNDFEVSSRSVVQ